MEPKKISVVVVLRRRLELLQSNRPPQHRHGIAWIKRKRRITVPNDIPMPRRDHIRIAPRATRIQRSDDVVLSSLCHCERTRIQLCGMCEIDIIVRVRSGIGALTECRRQRPPFLHFFFAVGGTEGKERKEKRTVGESRAIWRLESGLLSSLVLDESRMAAMVKAMAAAVAAAPMKNSRRCSGVMDVAVNIMVAV